MASVSTESPNFHTRPRSTVLISNPIEYLPRIGNLAGDRGGRDREWTGEIDVRIHAALATLEVARGRGDADLAIGQESDARLADAATRRDDLHAGFEQRLDQAFLHAAQVYRLRGRRHEEAHAFGDLAPLQHSRRDLDVLEPAVRARADLRLIDALADHF